MYYVVKCMSKLRVEYEKYGEAPVRSFQLVSVHRDELLDLDLKIIKNIP